LSLANLDDKLKHVGHSQPVNLGPDTAERDSEVMKTVVRMNENCAGVYGTVVRAGVLRVGQVVTLEG
jgi:hypothetical protein